jgi:hypothetical protein
MDTVGLTRERYNSRFLNVVPCGSQHSNVVPSKRQLREIYSPQQTLCCDKFLDHQQIREILKV